MNSFFSAIRGFGLGAQKYAVQTWRKYRALRARTQIIIAVAAVAVLIALFIVLQPSQKDTASESLRYVTLRNVGELSGDATPGTLFGTIRSVSEATVQAEASGNVTRVYTTLGATVGAGSIIAELENASEQASVLQAEGVYDAAIASRNAASLSETETSAEATYRSAFATMDNVTESYIDSFFTGPASAPNLTIHGGGWDDQLKRSRATLATSMDTWRYGLGSASTKDPLVLLNEASSVAETTANFLNTLALVATRPNSGATETQLSNLTTARSSVNTLVSTLSAARSTYQSGSVGATASADASVKQALGALRYAQANLEKTRFRAPIAGTVNFLPVRVGDFVTANTHVATIAQNHALEAVAYVSEETRNTLSVGASVRVEEKYDGVITAIAPALDPVTKQIEVRIGISNAPDSLVNGSSVKIHLSTITAAPVAEGPLSLPLSSVKLRADDRVVFGIDEESRLVAYAVTTGSVHGDRIEITNDLPRSLTIVTDARGLAEGQKVSVSQ